VPVAERMEYGRRACGVRCTRGRVFQLESVSDDLAERNHPGGKEAIPPLDDFPCASTFGVFVLPLEEVLNCQNDSMVPW
jgi:hypothetical protein